MINASKESGWLGVTLIALLVATARRLPRKALNAIKRRLMETATIRSKDKEDPETIRFSRYITENQITWLNKHYYNFNGSIRFIKIGGGKWAYFKYNGCIGRTRVTDNSNNGNSSYVITRVIELYGFKRNKMMALAKDERWIKEIAHTHVKVDFFDDEGSITTVRKGDLTDPVTIPITEGDVGVQLYDTIENFLSKKQWYVENRIPYKLNILLHGTFGTGKSYLALELLANFFSGIRIMEIGKSTAMSKIIKVSPRTTVKINGDFIVRGACPVSIYNDINNIPQFKKSREGASNDLGFTTTSKNAIYQFLDGYYFPFDFPIVNIFTCNHLEDIDPAVIRDGRMDYVVELFPFSSKAIHQFIERHYKDDYHKVKDYVFKNKYSVGKLMSMFKLNLHDFDGFMELLNKAESEPQIDYETGR